MSVFATELALKTSGEIVAAELHDDLPIESLFDAEEVWRRNGYAFYGTA